MGSEVFQMECERLATSHLFRWKQICHRIWRSGPKSLAQKVGEVQSGLFEEICQTSSVLNGLGLCVCSWGWKPLLSQARENSQYRSLHQHLGSSPPVIHWRLVLSWESSLSAGPGTSTQFKEDQRVSPPAQHWGSRMACKFSWSEHNWICVAINETLYPRGSPEDTGRVEDSNFSCLA